MLKQGLYRGYIGVIRLFKRISFLDPCWGLGGDQKSWVPLGILKKFGQSAALLHGSSLCLLHP